MFTYFENVSIYKFSILEDMNFFSSRPDVLEGMETTSKVSITSVGITSNCSQRLDSVLSRDDNLDLS